jgi:hypothetical protein
MPHGKQERLLAKVAQHFKEKEQERQSDLQRHGHARPQVSLMMGDNRVIVIGGLI